MRACLAALQAQLGNGGASLFLASLGAIVSCGARSQLPAGASDAGPLDAMAPVSPPPAPGSACRSDDDCVPDRYCVVSGRCDAVDGCTFASRSCDDGVDCTRDSCDDVLKRCDHAPDDTRCEGAQLCSPKRGCDAFVYAVASDGHLYEARVPSGELVDVGISAAYLGDVALDSSGALFATDSYNLYGIDRATSAATAIASILPLHMYNGLGVLNGASLLATADVPDLFEVDRVSGASVAGVAFPPGYRASGDVTALGDRVFVAAKGSSSSTDVIVELTLSSQSWNVVGDVGFPCVWGLATLGGVVYGLTCEGRILVIDSNSGAGTQIARAAPAFFGAAAR
jgi:hypothetical protein